MDIAPLRFIPTTPASPLQEQDDICGDQQGPSIVFSSMQSFPAKLMPYTRSERTVTGVKVRPLAYHRNLTGTDTMETRYFQFQEDLIPEFKCKHDEYAPHTLPELARNGAVEYAKIYQGLVRGPIGRR
jgi:hypothetical protein